MPPTDSQAAEVPPGAVSEPDSQEIAGELFVCPFCGEASATSVACRSCGARTDPLSRQATQNQMGPWFVRDAESPFRPGCSLATIERWIRTGRITPETVIRGPSTSQNWAPARRVPGVARLFGRCHGCDEAVREDELICGGCGSALQVERDRQHLGLSPVRPIPGKGSAEDTVALLLLNEPTPTRGAGHAPDRPRALPASQPEAREAAARPGEVATSSSREAFLAKRLGRARRNGRIAIGIAAVAVSGLLAAIAGGGVDWRTGDGVLGSGDDPVAAEIETTEDPQSVEDGVMPTSAVAPGAGGTTRDGP